MNKQYLAKFFIILLCTTTFFNINTVLLAKQDQAVEQALSEDELHALFDTYTQQLNTAKAHLQQINELILLKQISVQNPIKINTAIKDIQEEIDLLISFIDANYTVDSLVELAYISEKIIEYLTTTAQYSIANLSTKDMSTFITKEMENSHFNGDFARIIEENEKNLHVLGSVCDNAGLSTFSQTYRYLSKNNIFWATRQAAFWGTVAGLVGLYFIWDSKNLNFNMTNEMITSKDPRYEQVKKHLIEGNPIQGFQGIDPLAHKQKEPFTFNLNKWLDSTGLINTEKVSDYMDEWRATIYNKTKIDILTILPNAIITAAIIDPIRNNSINWITSTWNDLSILATDGTEAVDRYLKGEKQKSQNSFTQASYKRAYFTDMVNGQHLEKIVDEYVAYINNPERYDRTGTAPCKGILLVGPPQTGKSFFASAFLTAIEERCEKFSRNYKFFPYTASDIARAGLTIEKIFANAYANAPAVIFFDEIDMMAVNREQNSFDTSAFLTQMSGLMSEHSEKQVFVIAATNKPERLDFALLQKGRLGRIIPFEYPTVDAREIFITKQLEKRSVTFPQDFIHQLAKETEGISYNALSEIITEALRSAKQQMRLVTQADMTESFDKHTRKIAPYSHKEYTAEDKKYIATYQAGKAVAIKALQPNTNIAKITILPVIKNINTENPWEVFNKEKDKNIEHEQPFTKESYQFGNVFTYHVQESLGLKNTRDIENEYIALIAGSIAQEILFNNTSLTLFKEDYSKANALLYELTQNEYFSKEDREKTMKAIEQRLREKARSTLQAHLASIQTIAQKLIIENTIDEKTFTQLFA